MYVELEGVHRTNHTLPLTEPDLVATTLSDLKIGLSELKTDSAKKTLFDREYERRAKENDVLKKRRQFNDVSKTYVFVLLAHSGIGKLTEVRNLPYYTYITTQVFNAGKKSATFN